MESNNHAPVEEPFVVWQKENADVLKEIHADRESTILLYKFALAKRREYRARKEPYARSLPNLLRDIAHRAVEYRFWSISQGQRHFRIPWKESRMICYKMHELGIVKFNGYYVTDIVCKTHYELIDILNAEESRHKNDVYEVLHG